MRKIEHLRNRALLKDSNYDLATMLFVLFVSDLEDWLVYLKIKAFSFYP